MGKFYLAYRRYKALHPESKLAISPFCDLDSKGIWLRVVFSVIIYEGINKTPYIEVTIVHNTRVIEKMKEVKAVHKYAKTSAFKARLVAVLIGFLSLFS
jgi:hypothetical protein